MNTTQGNLNFAETYNFNISLVKGQDFIWDLHLLDAKEILSSTKTSPISLTISNHGLSSNDTVFVQNHLINTNANTSEGVLITVTDENTYTLSGTTGNGVGFKTGSAGKGLDLSAIDVECYFKDFADANTIIATPTINYVNRSVGKFQILLGKAITKTITVNSCYYEVWLNETNNYHPIMAGNVTFYNSINN